MEKKSEKKIEEKKGSYMTTPYENARNKYS